jgi:predicted adenylyl cyclase CyaB
MENLEIKCHYSDTRFAEHVAREQLGADRIQRLVQTDSYFRVPRGRLKLRRIKEAGTPEHHELISYQRDNNRGPRSSKYEVLPVADGHSTLAFFTACLGLKVEVHKVRKAIVKGNLRIHIDAVRGLGNFLEFELAVTRAHPVSACRKQMQDLLTVFRIAKKDLIAVSYADLLLRAQRLDAR